MLARLCFLLLGALSAAHASAQIDIGAGLRVDVPARTLKDLRDQNLVRQQFDFSCGAAALATILRYAFADDVDEAEILGALLGSLTDEERAIVGDTGFSLLDLQNAAQARGYRAGGFRLQPDQLEALSGPVIAYIEPRGYRHFAVLRGISGDRVFLADPSRGNVRMPLYRFLDDWLQDDGMGIIFVVEPETGLPQSMSPLALDDASIPLPEIMSASEMLAVGNPSMRWPSLTSPPP